MCKTATDFPSGHKAYMRQTPPSAGVHEVTQLYDSLHGFPLSTHAFLFFFITITLQREQHDGEHHKDCLAFPKKNQTKTTTLKYSSSREIRMQYRLPGGVSVEFRKDRWGIKNRLLAWFYCSWSSYGSGDWETITISDEQMHRLTDANPAYTLKSPGRGTTASGQWVTDTLHHLYNNLSGRQPQSGAVGGWGGSSEVAHIR